MTILQRKTVGAILLSENGEILLQQRDDKPDLRYAGYWTFFGGAVEDGEHPEEAIRRELVEELELDDQPLTFWWAYECPVRTVPGEVVTINHMYYGTLSRPLEALTLHEGQAMRFFQPRAALALTLAFAQTPVLQRFLDEFTPTKGQS